MYDELTIWHESGHAVAAHALGRRVGFVTVVPGGRWAGMTRTWAELIGEVPADTAPLVTRPGALQRRLAGDAVFAFAGDIAEGLFVSRGIAPVRLPESAAVAAQDFITELAGGAATSEELAEAARRVDAPGKSDAECIAALALQAHGGDPCRAAAWTAWAAAEARALLLLHEPAVRRVAAVLARHGTIGEQAAAAALRGETAR